MLTSNKTCAKRRRDAKTSDERRRFAWAPDTEYSQGRTSILSTERGTTSDATTVDVWWSGPCPWRGWSTRRHARGVCCHEERCAGDEGGRWNVRATMPSLRGGGYSGLLDAGSNRFTRLFQPLLLRTPTCAEPSRIGTCAIHSVIASSLLRRKHSFTTSMCSTCLVTNGNGFPFHSRIQPNEEGSTYTFPFARHRNGWNLVLLSFVDDMFALEGSVHYADPRGVCTGGSLKSTPTDASTQVHDVSNVARVRVSPTTTLPSPCLRAFLAGNTAHLHHPREETPTVWTSLKPRFRWGARQRRSSGIETEDRSGSIGRGSPIETGDASGLFRIGEETCAWTCHTRYCRRRIGMKLTLKTVAGKQFQVEAEAEETVRGPFAAEA